MGVQPFSNCVEFTRIMGDKLARIFRNGIFSLQTKFVSRLLDLDSSAETKLTKGINVRIDSIVYNVNIIALQKLNWTFFF